VGVKSLETFDCCVYGQRKGGKENDFAGESFLLTGRILGNGGSETPFRQEAPPGRFMMKKERKK